MKKAHFKMSIPIFYIESFGVLDASFILNEDTSKHILQVLRMAEGENLQLTDGKGNLIDATIAVAHKKKCIVKFLLEWCGCKNLLRYECDTQNV